MAFTITQRDDSSNTTTSDVTHTSGSFTPTANSRLFVVGIAQFDSAASDYTFPNTGISNTGGLSFTSRQKVTTGQWGTGFGYNLCLQVWYADVGSSPGAMTVTIDMDSTGGAVFFYSLIAFDVTGFDSGTPFAQSDATNSEDAAAGDKSLTATFGSSPTSGNMVLAAFAAGADSGGGFATPTGFTSLTNQNHAFTQGAVFYHTSTTSTTVTCSDVGNAVGNSAVVAMELTLASEPPPAGGMTLTPAMLF